MRGTGYDDNDRLFVCGARLSLADVRFHCLYRFFSAADAEQAADPGLTHLHGYIERLAARTTQPDGARSAKL